MPSKSGLIEFNLLVVDKYDIIIHLNLNFRERITQIRFSQPQHTIYCLQWWSTYHNILHRMHFGFHRRHHNKAYCCSLLFFPSEFLESTIDCKQRNYMSNEMNSWNKYSNRMANKELKTLITTSISFFRDYYQFNCHRQLYVFFALT